MKTLARPLNRLFNIRAEEWPRFLLLYLMAFLFIAGSTWGELNVQTSFLFQIGVQNLPQVLVANALVSIIAIAIYTPFVDRVTNDKLLIAISVIGAVAIGIGYTLLGLGQPAIAYPLLYLLSIVVRQTFNLHWWTYVAGFYDTRAAKRIVPLLATAARLSIIFAGQTIPFLNAVISPSSNIILLWLGSLLVIAIAAWLMPRLLKEQKTPPAASDSRPSFTRNVREGYRYVSHSPFLRWMAFSTLFMMLLFALIEYYTSYIFTYSFSSGEELANFLGRLSSLTSLILLPFQLFLFSRLVGRLGLGNANLIFPTGALAIGGALVGWPQVSTSALGYLERKIFRPVFRNPTDNLLYNAVPLHVKGRARAFIGGLVAPLGSLVGAGLLLALPFLPGDRILRALIGAATLAYFISAFVVRRRYSQALITMLEQEDFSFLISSTSELTVADSATLDWLTKKLETSPGDDFTIFIAHLVSRVGGNAALPILGRAAQAGDAAVRSAILDLLAAADVRGGVARALYTSFLDDPDGRVRRSAIAGLGQLSGPENGQFLERALDMLSDPDVDVRTQVIPPLVKSGDFFYLASAIQTLSDLAKEKSPALRARGVRVLGQIGDVRFIRNLARYLDDPDDQVQVEAAAAIESLAQAKIPERVAGSLLEHLSRSPDNPVERVRLAAVAILRQIEMAEANQLLVRFLSDPSRQVREGAIDALVSLGQQAVSLLSPALESPDLQLRKMATVVLGRVQPEQFGPLIESHINNSLRTIYANYGRLEALSQYADYPSISVLQSVLEEQNCQLTQEIFYLLTAIHDPESITVIVESLDSDAARVRANAIEALEALTTPQMAQMMAPLFDPQIKRSGLLRIAQETWEIPPLDSAQVIRQLMTAPSPTLRAIMVFALGEIGAAFAAGEARLAPKRDGPSSAALLGKLIGDSEVRKPGMRRPRPSPPLDKLTQAYGSAGGLPLPRREIEQLVQASLNDSDPGVRAAAQAAWRKISGQRAIGATPKENTMLSTIERVIFLKEVPFFQGMTIDQLQALAGICEEKFFAQDTPIFEQGDPGGVLYVVVSGRVAIEREGQRKGSVVRLATVEARSYFGEMSLFDRGPRSAAARAIQDTITLRLRREPLIALVRQYPDLSLELIHVLSQRVRQANDKIAQLTRSRPRELDKLYDKLV